MLDVVLSIVGTQCDATGEESRIELITVGHYYERNGIQYLVYKDSEVSGLEGTTTMLKIYQQHVVLVRTGSIKYKQEFRLNEKNHSAYVTSYNSMNMSILTTSINLSLGNPAGNIDICYELEINGHWQSANTLSISVREES